MKPAKEILFLRALHISKLLCATLIASALCATACPAAGCTSADDCEIGYVCDRTYCVSPVCTDLVKNGLETDMDCGGDCAPCQDGKMCLAGTDCLSQVCTGGICTATCFDFVQNGTETGIDCGGDCAPCPIPITMLSELQSIGNAPEFPLGGTYELMNDLDAAGIDFSPIGTEALPFTGTFKGNGHSIRNLRISRSGQDNIGLFGYVASGAISGLGLDNATVFGTDSVGILAGFAEYSSFTNCYSTGAVTGMNTIGGLVAENHGGSIVNSYSMASTTCGNGMNGGLVGWHKSVYSHTGSISNCFSAGTVSNGAVTGGLVGYNYEGIIANSYSSAAVSSPGNVIGGLVGNSNAGSITNSYSTGAVSGSSEVGGLIGRRTGGVITGCYWNSETGGANGLGSDTGSPAAELFGSTSAQLQQAGSFTGWDFSATGPWCIFENTTSPRFKWRAEAIVLHDDTYTAYESNPLNVDSPGMLGNDNDSMGTLRIFLVRGPDNGTLQLSADGSFTYTADPGFLGTDSFSYGIMNTCRTATVTILVLPCYSIDTAPKNFPAEGGSAIIPVSAAADYCTWEAGSTAAWITIGSDSGTGSDNITCSIAPNHGPARSGSIIIAGAEIPLHQADGCAYSLEPGSATVAYTGDNGTLTVMLTDDSDNACSWSAISDSWITLVSGATGAKNGTITYRVAANTGTARSGSISIPGGAFIINQQYCPVITTRDYLQKIGTELPLDGDYTLGSDISGTGVYLKPIGSCDTPFTGTFDGGNHTISFISINKPSDNCIGFFGATDGARISNLNFQNTTVRGYDDVGALVGRARDTTIENFMQLDPLVTGRKDVGGVAGSMAGGTIRNALNYITTGYGYVEAYLSTAGGIAGRNDGAINSSLFQGGSVRGGNSIGGITGENSGTVDSCAGLNNVSSSGQYTGGIAGRNFGRISNSLSAGSIWGGLYVGGIAGSMNDNETGLAEISSSYRAGLLASSSGESYLGGLVGWYTAGPVSQCHWDTETTGRSAAAGLGGLEELAGSATAQMKQQATFEGWDFMNTWCIREGVTSPQLFLPGLNPVTDTYAPGTYSTTASGIFVDFANGVLHNDLVGTVLFRRMTPVLMQDAAFGTVQLNANGSFTYTPYDAYGGIDTFTYSLGGCFTAPVTVTMPCSFAALPDNQTLYLSGEESQGSFQIITGNLCPWGATSTADWITIGSDNGSGSGEVFFTASRNTGAERTGSIIAAGMTFTIVQHYSQVIATAEDLQQIPARDLSGSYELSGDIDAAGIDFNPIGSCAAPFTGAFNGNGHTIRNIRIIRPDDNCTGLFGFAYNATVANLSLENASVQGASRVGTVIGYAKHVGKSEAYLRNCRVSGSVTGAGDTGGLVGSSDGFAVDHSFSSAAVSSPGSHAGGLVGNNNGIISSSYNAGTVTGDMAGGLAGLNAGNINESYNTGLVAGPGLVGALAGQTSGMIEYCYWDNETSAAATAFGFGNGDANAASTARMKQQSTFANWDFIDTWCIEENATYPGLNWRSAAVSLQADSYSLSAYGILSVDAPGLLANDNDTMGTPEALSGLGPHHGALQLSANGSFTYEPDPGFIGADNFTYSAFGACATATVIISVTPCTFGFDPAGALAGAAGGQESFILAPSGGLCPWEALPDEPWITGITPSSGAGGNTIAYTVAANTGPARSGTILIGDDLFMISQENGCTYEISPAGASVIDAGDESGFIYVTASDTACPWIAEADESWITITAGGSGTGCGLVHFTIGQNTTGATRTGTITVGGRVFRITQYSPVLGGIEDLQKIGTELPLDGDYMISVDIDAGGVDFSPIGSCDAPFTGTFDGAGHVIRNLHISRPADNCTGFFGAVYNARILNLILDNATVQGASRVGGLIGYAEEQGPTPHFIRACAVSGAVTGTGDSVGGIVGFSVNYGVLASVNTAAVSGTGMHIGGLVGTNEGGINVSYNRGAVEGGSFAGGLVGLNGAAGVVMSSYNAGPVSGTSMLGAVAGQTSGTVEFCYWDNETSGADSAFGAGTGDATGAPTARIMQQGTYEGWDFTDIWCIVENATYPQQLWFSDTIIAGDDLYSVSTYDTLIVAAPGVLGNDAAEVFPGNLSARVVSAPGHGTLQLSDNGSFSYTPDPGFSGTDTFTYTAGECSLATVAITVAECTISINPPAQEFSNSGGTGEITVSASGGNCPWTATTDQDWIILNVPGGTGSGPLSFTILENTGGLRSGSISINGQTCTINQKTACRLTIVPDSFQKLLYGTATCPGSALAEKFNPLYSAGISAAEIDMDILLAFLKLFRFTGPFKAFVITGEGDTVFTRADRLQWSSEAITTLLRFRFGPKLIAALVFINPLTAKEGDYTLIIGDCEGMITIENL